MFFFIRHHNLQQTYFDTVPYFKVNVQLTFRCLAVFTDGCMNLTDIYTKKL